MALVAALVVLTGCGGSSDDESAATSSSSAAGKADRSATLTIGLPTGPTTLDPTKDGYGEASILRHLTNESIVKMNGDGKYVPGLAEKFGYVGRGNRTFEFTLRKDARFSDGTPVTAQAVKEWFEYFPTAKGPNAGNLGLESVETSGKWTVRIHLKFANPIVPNILSGNTNWGFVTSPKSLAKPDSLGTSTNGAGQYALDPAQTVANNHYTLVANKYYYDQSSIKFGKVVIKVIGTPATMLQAMRSGQIDVALGDPRTAKAAKGAGLNVTWGPSGPFGLAFADHQGSINKALADVRVRQALNYAVDRKAITTAMMGEYATPSAEWENGDAHDPAAQNYYPYDPDKAKALLAEAGYPNGFSFEMVGYSGASGNVGVPSFQAMAKYLADIGVKVKIVSASSAGEYFKKAFGGEFAAVGLSWGPGITFVDYRLLLAPKSLVNTSNWSDPVLERLQAEAAAAPAEEATAIWKQMSMRIVQQGYMLPLFSYPYILYANDKIGGVEANKWSLYSSTVTEWFPK